MKHTFTFLFSAAVVFQASAQINLKDQKYENSERKERLEVEAPKKNISLQQIWKEYAFMQESVSGLRSMNDGLHYTVLEKGSLVKYAYKSGEKVATLIDANEIVHDGDTLKMDGYEFSADEQKILIATEVEAIYRRSSKAFYYVMNLPTKKITPIRANEKQMYADFSPEGDKVAYVINYNLFYKDLTKDEEIQITTDGEKNKIINGASDWVYEEELSLAQAFEWSSDGKKIAFYRFDESNVKQWNMKIYDGLYPTDYRFKYPKAGEENAKVGIRIYNLEKSETMAVNLGVSYEYLPSIKWTANANQLAVMSTNRHQNELKVNLVNANDGNSKVIHTEVSETYIEMPFDIYFTKDEKNFIILSENSGFRHLYLYNMNGKLQRQLTKGDWPVTDFYGIDEENGRIYYQAAEENPMNRNVFSANLKGRDVQKISPQEGTNRAVFSKSFAYYINYHTTANSPNYISLHQSDGKKIRTLKDNQALKDKLSNYNINKKEFFSFTTSEGVVLNGWMIKPPHYNPKKKHPAFLTIYGGPGSQTVTNSWGGFNYFWHQHLAQKGYVVVSVDNRGTGARGVDFKKITYKELGKYETMDQIEVAKYLAGLEFIDGKRIGVQGWSYGGYMSSLCILKGADHFKAAIAVAPVTNWRFYDSIYTERYMQTPQENSDGYDDNSPINHVEKLKGSYLLVHGMADDNVHLQNTSEMIEALVEADKQFDLFVYPNKNHGIYGGNTRYHLYKKMTDFLDANL